MERLPVASECQFKTSFKNHEFQAYSRQKKNDSELYAKDYFQNVSQKLSHCTYLM